MHDDDLSRPIPNEPPEPPPVGGRHAREVIDRSGDTVGKGPQHDLHAERSIAGAVIYRGQPAVDDLRDAGVEPGDIVDPTCQAVVSAAYELADNDVPIDPITIADELAGAVDSLYTIGTDGFEARGRNALVALHAAAPNAGVTRAHAAIVHRWARKRALGYVLVDAAEAHRLDDPARLQRALDQLAATNITDTLDADTTWQPINLEPYLDGTTSQPTPDYLHRDDGQALFYAGAVNGIHGDSGSGKGWVICRLIAENALHGRRTLLLDLEDTADSIVGRLLLLGMTSDQILQYLVYIRPQEPITGTVVAAWCKLIDDRNIATVIVDSLGEAFSLEGINEDKDVEVGPWLRAVARPLADTGASVVLVDHSTKANDNPLHPSGSKRKRAAMTGASYLAEAIKPFVKGEGGRLRLTCAKDRHGNYRRGETVADLVMDSDTYTVGLALYAPNTTTSDAPVPIVLAAKAAVAAAKTAGRTVSQNELVGLMHGIKAGTEIKRGGIDRAVSIGALNETKGARGARMFTYVTDLEDD